jgi:two-component system chemotaxis response regulator CheY
MNMRILIADDDPLMRTFVAVCLQDVADILEATDGAETISALEQAHVDLVLLDWNMPAPDGLAVLKILRAEGFRVPIVMVTALADRAHVLQALHAGASDYLIKPFDPTALREKVNKFRQVGSVASATQPVTKS